jgi:hypothetical protein
MPKFIIGYGLAEHTDVIEAPNQEAALNEAVGRSALDGIEDIKGDDGDWSWAIPYTEDKAWDLGLLDPPKQSKQAVWWG